VAVLGRCAAAAAALSKKGAASTLHRNGNALLHELAAGGGEAQLKLLLEGTKCFVNTPNDSGFSALHTHIT
jgi:hypothetical protein